MDTSIMSSAKKIIPNKVSTFEPHQSYTLSPEQLKFYDDHGYLVIKELIDFSSLYSYKRRFQQVCNGVVEKGQIFIVSEPALKEKGLKGEQAVNKIHDIIFDEVFGSYCEHPAVVDVVSQIIGHDVVGINAMFINKPPGSGRHPSHQDLFYFPYRPVEKIIGVWTAVDHVNSENGCLYIVPKSHKEKTLHPHGHKEEFTKLYHGILDEENVAPVHCRVNLEMSPGDTVFFHPLLVHGSRANTAKTYRKSISCHYANGNCYYIDVKGTVQERVAQEVEQEAARRGFEVNFKDVWKYRSKIIKGVRSNL